MLFFPMLAGMVISEDEGAEIIQFRGGRRQRETA